MFLIILKVIKNIRVDITVYIMDHNCAFRLKTTTTLDPIDFQCFLREKKLRYILKYLQGLEW